MSKFHITPSGEIKPCHAKEGGCPYGGNENHFDSILKAQLEVSKRYRTKLTQEEIVNYIQNTQFYHGTTSDFNEFDNNKLGSGNDIFGIGHYFTSNEQDASSYGDKIKKVKIKIKNPYILYSDENSSKITIPREAARGVLRSHPKAYLQPDEEGSIIGDYVEEYWDKDKWSKKELDKFINKMIDRDISLRDLESYFDSEEDKDGFVKALKSETGHDGVVVVNKDNSVFTVVWDSNDIEIQP